MFYKKQNLLTSYERLASPPIVCVLMFVWLFVCFLFFVFCFFFCGVHIAHLFSTLHVFLGLSSFCVLCTMILVSQNCPFLNTPLRFSLTIMYPLLVPTECKNVFVSYFFYHTHTHTHIYIYIYWYGLYIYIMENHNFNPKKKSSWGQFLSDFNNIFIDESMFVIFCSYFQMFF